MAGPLQPHQEVVAVEVINLIADAEVSIRFAANRLAEPVDLSTGDAGGLVDQLRPGHRMVDGGDVVVQQVGIGLAKLFPGGIPGRG
jgi:hypothetical protein